MEPAEDLLPRTRKSWCSGFSAKLSASPSSSATFCRFATYAMAVSLRVREACRLMPRVGFAEFLADERIMVIYALLRPRFSCCFFVMKLSIRIRSSAWIASASGTCTSGLEWSTMDGVSSTGDAFCAGLIIVLSSILTESFLLRRTIGFVGFNFIETDRCMLGVGPRFDPELYYLVTRL